MPRKKGVKSASEKPAKKRGESAGSEIKTRNSKFRTWLDNFIKDKKLRNREVGEMFGVNDSLIGHYRKGTRLPTYTTLQRIRVATKVDMNDLFDNNLDNLLK